MSIFSKRGVSVPHRKNTADCETVVMPAPARLTVSMSQHLGAPCTPTVKVGDTVTVGQVIGDSDRPVSSPVHSGVSGRVTAITDLLLSTGMRAPAVVIENDGEDRLFEGLCPPTVNNRDDFLKAVRASGLVGLGGAGFPPHIKLNPANLDEVDTLIINAAECEPYITTDYRECMENSWDIVSGVQTVMEFLDVRRTIIAIENNKPAAIDELRRIAAQVTTPAREVTVKSLPARYPQGAEKVLIQSATGRRVPFGKLPADAGCIVMNVTSIAFLSRYLKTGLPLTRKRLTVDGSAVANPQNVSVVVGTSAADLLAFCGTTGEVRKILYGGPMMGTAMADASMPILKQNNALLAFQEADALLPAPSACIRCGRCVAACPMHLVPPTLVGAYQRGDMDGLRKNGLTACMECGCCSYSCPANRPIVQTLRLAKAALRKEGK